MGRAERRLKERKERILDKKGRIALRPDEIRALRRRTADLVADFDVEVLLTVFAQVLHDNYGWGQKRVLRILESVDNTFGQVLNGELDVDEMQRKLEDEVGVRIWKRDRR